jgi:hypothetical protein
LTQHCLPWMQSMNGVYYANTVKTHWRNMIRKKQLDWNSSRNIGFCFTKMYGCIMHVMEKVLADISGTPE